MKADNNRLFRCTAAAEVPASGAPTNKPDTLQSRSARIDPPAARLFGSTAHVAPRAPSRTMQKPPATSSGREVFNPAEAVARFMSMSPPEESKLRAAARRIAMGTPFEAGDLMHEVLCRTLAGRRSWPKDVPLSAFWIMSMRSIASHSLCCSEATTSARIPAEKAMDGAVAFGAAYQRSAEDEALRRQEDGHAARIAWRALDSLSRPDNVARSVLAGLMGDQSPGEIMASLGLDTRQYDAVLKRVARALRRAQTELGQSPHESPQKGAAPWRRRQ